MGLAPIKQHTEQILNNLIDLKDDGTFMLDQKFFNYSTGLMTNKNLIYWSTSRNPDTDKITQFHMDITSSIQNVTEGYLKLARSLKDEYKIPNLCLAG